MRADRVLLTMADLHGTLAALRCYGRAGVAVTVAEWRVTAAAQWSRFTSRRVRCPDPVDSVRFIDWLLDFGSREPGYVLVPPNDEIAWLYALNREVLSRDFKLYMPTAAALNRLLDKVQLHTACEAVGLGTPDHWLPTSLSELEHVSNVASYPVLIKPRTQVFSICHAKGAVVLNREELVSKYTHFQNYNRYNSQLTAQTPDSAWPMLQRFYPTAANSIYGLSGFAADTPAAFGARGSRKVLQRPRRLGIGLCFEEAPVIPELAEGVRRLCEQVGFKGIFEAEFIEADGRYLMIDFNPRCYNQMAFDIARGLPLPLLYLEAAMGNHERLLAMANQASRWSGEQQVYTHRFLFELLVRCQTLSRRLSSSEAKYWQSWRAEHRGHTVQAVSDSSDWVPELVDTAFLLSSYLRDPKYFLRTVFLGR